MTSSLYNKVRDAIVEVIPDIMDVKFGCRIRSKIQGYGVIEGKAARQRGEKEDTFVCMPADSVKRNTLGSFFCPMSGMKVLGRPITLEDVLRAMDKNDNAEGVSVNRDGRFVNILYDVSEQKEIYNDKNYPYWRLGKPLHDQSNECIEFLASVLRKEKTT